MEILCLGCIADPPAAFFFLWLTIHVKIEVGKGPCIFSVKPDQFGHMFPCPLTFLYIVYMYR